MIIPINVSHASSSTGCTFPPQLAQFGIKEMVLIELQGSLEVEGEKEGQVVGTLHVDENSEKPALLIGHHLLEGKLVNLSKPLAILHRSNSGNTQDNRVNNMLIDGGGSSSSDGVGWDIVAVVKRKLVFSKRPMPMVGKVTAPVSSAGPGK